MLQFCKISKLLHENKLWSDRFSKIFYKKTFGPPFCLGIFHSSAAIRSSHNHFSGPAHVPSYINCLQTSKSVNQALSNVTIDLEDWTHLFIGDFLKETSSKQTNHFYETIYYLNLSQLPDLGSKIINMLSSILQ